MCNLRPQLRCWATSLEQPGALEQTNWRPFNKNAMTMKMRSFRNETNFQFGQLDTFGESLMASLLERTISRDSSPKNQSDTAGSGHLLLKSKIISTSWHSAGAHHFCRSRSQQSRSSPWSRSSPRALSGKFWTKFWIIQPISRLIKKLSFIELYQWPASLSIQSLWSESGDEDKRIPDTGT